MTTDSAAGQHAVGLTRRVSVAIPRLQREILLLQREILLSSPGWLFQLLLVGSSPLDLPRVRLSRFFARTPQGARHWPECRCIFS